MRSIPWLRVLIEGAVIVGSIPPAFGIEGWWADRGERQEEASLLTDLAAEFEENRVLLDFVTQRHQDFVTQQLLFDPPVAFGSGSARSRERRDEARCEQRDDDSGDPAG